MPRKKRPASEVVHDLEAPSAHSWERPPPPPPWGSDGPAGSEGFASSDDEVEPNNVSPEEAGLELAEKL
eukprot:6695946-Alexandrium_andersonii.AAC.1